MLCVLSPSSPLLYSASLALSSRLLLTSPLFSPHSSLLFSFSSCCSDFFKRVRARHYVFSAVNPSKEVLDALIQAKSTWDDKDAQVTIVPTHETETLFNWMSVNHEVNNLFCHINSTRLSDLSSSLFPLRLQLLEANCIDVAPCASRCTVTLQDHETSCAAYRIEF